MAAVRVDAVKDNAEGCIDGFSGASQAPVDDRAGRRSLKYPADLRVGDKGAELDAGIGSRLLEVGGRRDTLGDGGAGSGRF